MKVLIVGHSYVRDLARLQGWHQNSRVTLDNNTVVSLEYQFQSYPGKDFDHFLNHPELFNRIGGAYPDIIVVILGGNAIVSNLSNSDLRGLIRAFYGKLNEVLYDGCIRIAMQVEPRRPRSNNRHGAPTYALYSRRRNIANSYYNRSIRNAGDTMPLCLVCGQSLDTS